MRDLTEKELSLAPDWATHLYEDGHGNLRLLDMENFISCSVRYLPEIRGTLVLDKNHYGVKSAIPLERKLFDISEHEFSDKWVELSGLSGTFVTLELHNRGDFETLNINKPDAIAIAKALGVTGEDLL